MKAEWLTEARALRAAWQSFAETHPDSPRADEARVRAIEAGWLAFRLGGERADRDAARKDAKAYLSRPDSAQADRVRAVLAALE